MVVPYERTADIANIAFPPADGMKLSPCANVRQQARHDIKFLQ
ncbi:hypothetical protein ENTCAN_06365 [Enterobacter cancerogenus ATCC 35316]|nr:hypothetical protein ENTCAN_06365 [Enterobacter cancerogenus ATCC 35316]